MILNNSNTKTFLIVLTFFIFSCGGNSANNSNDSAQIDIANEIQDESLTNSNNESEKEKNEQTSKSKANIDEVLKEFPQGALSFLSPKEQECIAENSSTESLKDMEKNLMQEGAILQQQMDYFTNCNIPSPPGIGIKEAPNPDESNSSDSTSNIGSLAKIENLTSLEFFGTSPHLERVDDSTVRLFYNDLGGVAVLLCSNDLNCETQGSIQFITDLTIVQTKAGERRGYFVELNPNTRESGIFTASFSEDGLSYSNKTPLGITAQKDEVAWGVPDAVVMPNGLVRVYWVYTEDRTSPEKIVSATSKTEKGIEFTLDPGYRVDNGYVDFEVLKAEDGDWQALMSYTPHYLPSTPQSLFYAISKDGLTWEFSEERITPRDYSYLDPTGIPIDDKSYLIVMGGAPNAMGDREYQLFTAELILP